MKPYYEDGSVTLYHGDCCDLFPVDTLHELKYVVVTDPPYPNNAGHFDESVEAALGWLQHLHIDNEAIVFWSEIERPPVPMPLVAVHVWHRANVNGRPYEPAYHFCLSGRKRRSEVLRHAAIFDGAGPGCAEYLGHPTQKPVALMRRLLLRTGGHSFLDPFAGSGSTLRAAKDLGFRAVGVEVDERYCEIAAKRCAQEVLDLGDAA